jgi:uncharacterized protein YsxB (DUF464 family)
MIQAEFFKSDGKCRGFRISGHAGFAESGHDIVCASVSSAVQLTANLLTDGFNIDADVSAKDNVFECKVKILDEKAVVLFDMLKTHLGFISEEFPKRIKITTLEV